MGISIAAAADTFAHYIELAIEKSGGQMTPDMRSELTDAKLAFHEAAGELDRLTRGAHSKPDRLTFRSPG